MNRLRAIFALCLILLFGTGVAGAAPIPLEEFAGRWLIVVYTNDSEDFRPFEVNLAFSEEWNRFESRGVEIVDVYPGRWDVEAVAEQFDIVPPGFAVVLVDPQGEVRYVTRTVPTATELTAQIDL